LIQVMPQNFSRRHPCDIGASEVSDLVMKRWCECYGGIVSQDARTSGNTPIVSYEKVLKHLITIQKVTDTTDVVWIAS